MVSTFLSSLPLFMLLARVNVSNSFTVNPPRASQVPQRITFVSHFEKKHIHSMVSTGIDQEGNVVTKGSVPDTPNSHFGREISEEMVDFNKATVGFIKTLLFDTLFKGEGRDYARFYALETIARMP